MYGRASVEFRLRVYPHLDHATREAFDDLGVSSVCVDVGANVGLVSKAMRNQGAVVHAVEPNPWARKSLDLAAVRDSLLQVHHFAASTREGIEELFVHNNHSRNPKLFSSGSSLLTAKPNVSEHSIPVQGVDFAKFIQSIGVVDFLKIDIEGFEVELIPHLVRSGVLAEVGFVAVETHDGPKWKELREPTREMVRMVEAAGLGHRFSWMWP